MKYKAVSHFALCVLGDVRGESSVRGILKKASSVCLKSSSLPYQHHPGSKTVSCHCDHVFLCIHTTDDANTNLRQFKLHLCFFTH